MCARYANIHSVKREDLGAETQLDPLLDTANVGGDPTYIRGHLHENKNLTEIRQLSPSAPSSECLDTSH
eukprot:6242266-Pyramimonas_sp.AAC.1